MFVKKPIGIGLMLGLLALAFGALPALASATTLKTAAGPLSIGDPVTAFSNSLITKTKAGTLSCEDVELNGSVASNGGTLAEVSITEAVAEGGGASPGDCALVGNSEVEGVTVTVESVGPIKFDALTATDESPVKFAAQIHPVGGGSVTCVFQGNIVTSYALNSPLGDVVEPSPLTTEAGTGCPVPGGEMEGEFTVTSGGAAVEVG